MTRTDLVLAAVAREVESHRASIDGMDNVRSVTVTVKLNSLSSALLGVYLNLESHQEPCGRISPTIK